MEDCRLTVYENRVLRRIYGPKMEEVAGEWRRLHNKEPHNMYTSPYIIKMIKERMRLAQHTACMGEIRNAYKISVRKLLGKRPLGKPMHKWEDNIRVGLGETGRKSVD
jgi:hypothetical protein